MFAFVRAKTCILGNVQDIQDFSETEIPLHMYQHSMHYLIFFSGEKHASVIFRNGSYWF